MAQISEGLFTNWTYEHLCNVVSEVLQKQTVKNVYLASCFDDFQRMQLYAEMLTKTGKYAVCARWIYRTFPECIDDRDAFMRMQANEDMEDMDNCDILILFTDSKLQTSLGGMHVELGLILERNRLADFYVTLPVEIYLVGPRTNVYTHLIPKQFETFSELLQNLEGING